MATANITAATTLNNPALITTLAAALAACAVVVAALRLPGSYERSAAEVAYRAASLTDAGLPIAALDELAAKVDASRAAFLDLRASQMLDIRSVDGQARLVRAERRLARGLAASPADAYAWTRLATVRSLLGRRGAGAALTTALLLAPHDRRLAALQFDLGVLLWPQLDATGRDVFARRVRFVATTPELAKRFAKALHALSTTNVGQGLSQAPESARGF